MVDFDNYISLSHTVTDADINGRLELLLLYNYSEISVAGSAGTNHHAFYGSSPVRAPRRILVPHLLILLF